MPLCWVGTWLEQVGPGRQNSPGAPTPCEAVNSGSAQTAAGCPGKGPCSASALGGGGLTFPGACAPATPWALHSGLFPRSLLRVLPSPSWPPSLCT